MAFIDEGGIVSESLDDQKDAIKELQTNLKARAGSNRSFPLLQEALNALDANRASIDELVNKAGEFLNQVSGDFDALNQMLTFDYRVMTCVAKTRTSKKPLFTSSQLSPSYSSRFRLSPVSLG